MQAIKTLTIKDLEDVELEIEIEFASRLFFSMSTCEDDFEKFNRYAINSLSNVA